MSVVLRSLGGLSLLEKGDKRARDLRPTRTISPRGLCDRSSIPMVKLCDRRALSAVELVIHYCNVRDEVGVVQWEHIEMASVVRDVFSSVCPIIGKSVWDDEV